MQSRRWNEVYRVVGEVAAELPVGSRRFADRVIVLVLLWAALNHKPISWACRRGNWAVWMQRLLPRVPSSTTMSRRLRRDSIAVFLDRVLERVQAPLGTSLLRALDGTGLEIRGHSKDRQAGVGYSAGRRAKGYKLHVLLDAGGAVVAWRLAPMNTNEKVMAARMLRAFPQQAYVLGDGNYDSNKLHALVSQHGGQLLAPLRVSKVRRRRGSAGRARCAAMLEGPSPFGRDLLARRGLIERFFGNADSHCEGLGELPAWVRTQRRVRLWVHAKLIINAARIRLLKAA
jgi:hypothetical protein